jgi:hypothetical protein
MTLIEVLATYRFDLLKHGRKYANNYVKDICEPLIANSVIETFNEDGSFVFMGDIMTMEEMFPGLK